MSISKKVQMARLSFWAGTVTTLWGAFVLIEKIHSESVDLFWASTLFLVGGVLLVSSFRVQQG
ncbi:hypothetical protein [Pseudomonas sp. XWY-1]|uniref:hypothetical protein n=1 Tax=Pseudomonas sp. XWY-1 TaxID=2069256 RepID=UPI000CF47ECB|nr:hypothetical protein [Pseudomonas sp. XWY-1]